MSDFGRRALRLEVGMGCEPAQSSNRVQRCQEGQQEEKEDQERAPGGQDEELLGPY